MQFQPIAKTADGAQRHAVGLQLAAQARHVHLDRVRRDFLVPAGQSLQQLVLAGGLGGVDQQVLQHRPLTRPQLDQLARGLSAALGCVQPHAHAAIGGVQLQRAEAQDGRGGGLRPPQQCAQPGQQFGQFIGLDHVVVGAQIEPLHTVMQRVARGQDQHRHLRVRHLGQTQPLGELQPIHAGQADVDDRHIEGLGPQHLFGALAAAHPIDRIACIRQAQLDAAGQHHIVFDQQETHAGCGVC